MSILEASRKSNLKMAVNPLPKSLKEGNSLFVSYLGELVGERRAYLIVITGWTSMFCVAQHAGELCSQQP